MPTETPVPPAQATRPPRVVGLDLSLTATGIASSAGWCRLVGHPSRRPGTGITQLPLPQRLEALRDLVYRVTRDIGALDLAVIEAPAVSRSGGGAHERGWLWWRIYGYLADAEIPVATMTPGQLKTYATGKGNGTKSAVVDAVARRWPDWETGGDDNLADAVVLMAAGMDQLGYPVAPMPRAHRAVLERVTWPHMHEL